MHRGRCAPPRPPTATRCEAAARRPGRPRFTFHGFRYAEIDGWPGELTADDLEAVVCHSDLRRTGWFECSDERVNQLHRNIVWGMRGNFLDVPTDCPQRDERLGWTGDLTVFAPTANFLYDTAGFLESWLADLAAEQSDTEGVPLVVPDVLRYFFPIAIWGDAAIAVPWAVYRSHGDLGPAPHPVGQHAALDRAADRLGRAGSAVDRPPARRLARPGRSARQPRRGPNRPDARRPGLVRPDAHPDERRWPRLLGQPARAERYATIAAEARAAFVREYVTPAGRLMSDSETAHALAVRFDLVPAGPQRDRIDGRLPELVRESGHHIRTGFAGTPIITDALCDAGAVDDAYRLLLQEEPLSWLYAVTMGATTVWERWDGLRPDGTLNPGEMNSFNHYALGSVADWLHRSVAGLAPGAPGYRRLLVHPLPGPGLTAAGRAAGHALRPGRGGVAPRRRRARAPGRRAAQHRRRGPRAGPSRAPRGRLGDPHLAHPVPRVEPATLKALAPGFREAGPSDVDGRGTWSDGALRSRTGHMAPDLHQGSSLPWPVSGSFPLPTEEPSVRSSLTSDV